MRLASALMLLWLAEPFVPERVAPAATPQGNGISGMLLVAEPELDDPNFDHTIVLMIHHDDEGALGVVVNRPYGTAPTAELLRRLGRAQAGIEGETKLFYGGPVQPEVGMLVHGTDYGRADTKQVTAEIAVTSDPAALADFVLGKASSRAVPVLGYAGWGPGQLESELAQGAWFTLPADPALVFAPDPAKAWEAAFARRGVEL